MPKPQAASHLPHDAASRQATWALVVAAGVLVSYAAAALPALPAPLQHGLREGLGFFMVAVPALRSAPNLAGPAARRSLCRAGWLGAVVLPAWVLGRALWWGCFDFVWPSLGWPQAVAVAAALWTHVVAVALPEELFWRSYVQGTLAARWPAKRRLAGAPFGAAAVLSSALFALSHVAGGGAPARLATFIPGLLFAWSMARDRSVCGPWALHAGCNLVALAAAHLLPIFPPGP